MSNEARPVVWEKQSTLSSRSHSPKSMAWPSPVGPPPGTLHPPSFLELLRAHSQLATRRLARFGNGVAFAAASCRACHLIFHGASSMCLHSTATTPLRAFCLDAGAPRGSVRGCEDANRTDQHGTDTGSNNHPHSSSAIFLLTLSVADSTIPVQALPARKYHRDHTQAKSHGLPTKLACGTYLGPATSP